MPTRGKKESHLHTKTKVGYFILGLLIIGLLWSVICPPNHRVSDTYSGQPGVTPEVTKNIKLSQKFTPDRNYDFFGIFYPNYQRFIEKGKLFIKVSSDERPSQHFEYNVSDLKNEAYLYVQCPIEAGIQYELELWSEEVDRDMGFIFTTIIDEDEAPLYINGKQQDGTLLMNFVYEQKNYFVAWYFTLGITLMAIYIILTINKDTYGKTK